MDKNLKLPSRNYWEGFKARNEALWDKLKNNTFVNMVFPVKEVSEGNTEAILPAVIPGGLTVKTMSQPLYVYSAKKLGQKGRGRPVSNINEITKLPITMEDILSAIKNNNSVRYEGITSEQEVQSVAKRIEAEKKANFRSIVLKQDKQDSAIKDLWDRQRGNYVKRLPREIIGTGPELTSQINVEKYYSYKPSISPEANLRKFKERMKTDFSFTDKSIEEIFNNTYSKYFNLRKQGGSVNYIDYCKNGSGIHIKKKNRGKFTDYCGGKVTEECILKGKHSSNPAIRKRATFAANARKWKHQDGGCLNYLNYIQNGLG